MGPIVEDNNAFEARGISTCMMTTETDTVHYINCIQIDRTPNARATVGAFVRFGFHNPREPH